MPPAACAGKRTWHVGGLAPPTLQRGRRRRKDPAPPRPPPPAEAAAAAAAAPAADIGIGNGTQKDTIGIGAPVAATVQEPKVDASVLETGLIPSTPRVVPVDIDSSVTHNDVAATAESCDEWAAEVRDVRAQARTGAFPYNP